MKLGVCYYPEQWPESMWADDARRMKELGLSLVRIAEFAWSRIEPEYGQFDWSWLDRAVQTLADAGLEIIMGTPTATPPKWLIDKHPDILPYDENGTVRGFGSRRHYSFSSKTYRQESARIVGAMVERYAENPAIVMWQTDNEYGCHDTVLSYDEDAKAAFRVWLRQRFGTIDKLNTAWGTVFWSQEYRSFEEIDPPAPTVTEANPSHRMDWRRFSSDQVAEYNALHTGYVRTLSPKTDITHNFMGHFTEFDHYPVAAQIDVSTWDSYPLGFLDQTWWDNHTKAHYLQAGHPDFAGFHHDLYRGMSKNGRFGVMEQQPGPVNWAPYNPAPLDGMVSLWTMEACAHGAELVSYFRWRQAPFAQEQMHAGLNRPDNVADKAAFEAEWAAQVLETIGPLPQTRQAKVALVYDYEAHWAYEIQPQGRSFRHDELTFLFYTALRRLGLDVDVISPNTGGEGYELVVIPSLPMLTTEQLTGLRKGGPHILAGPRTGSKTSDFQIPQNLAPGPLQDIIPIKVARVESLRPGIQATSPYGTVSRWIEHVESELDPVWRVSEENGILWRNEAATYLSAWPDEEMSLSLCANTCSKLGIVAQALPEGVRVRRRGDLIFVMNYGNAHCEEGALGAVLLGYERLTKNTAQTPGQFAVYRQVPLAD